MYFMKTYQSEDNLSNTMNTNNTKDLPRKGKNNHQTPQKGNAGSGKSAIFYTYFYLGTKGKFKRYEHIKQEDADDQVEPPMQHSNMNC